MIPGYAHDLGAGERGEFLLDERVLVRVAVVGEVAGDDNEVGFRRVDLVDRRA